MKKKFIFALATSLCIAAAGTVFATEDEASTQKIQIDGSIYTQWRSQRDSNFSSGREDYTRNGFKALLTLNVNAPLSKNLNAYTRMTYETLQHDWKTFMADYVASDSQHSAAIDAYGLTYKNAGYNYTLGKQYLTLGQGLVYDDNGNIGKYTAPYALNITGTLGVTDISLIAAKTDYQTGVSNDKIYAVQGSYNINPKTNVGAMFARVSYGDGTVSNYHLPKNSVNYYSVFGSYKLSDKAKISSEYSQANAQSDDKGFQTSISYKLDRKNSLSVGYYYIEDQANIIDYNIAGMTTGLANNAKGYLVSFKHQVDKNISFSVSDYYFKKINDESIGGNAPTNDRNRFYTTMTAKF